MCMTSFLSSGVTLSFLKRTLQIAEHVHETVHMA